MAPWWPCTIPGTGYSFPSLLQLPRAFPQPLAPPAFLPPCSSLSPNSPKLWPEETDGQPGEAVGRLPRPAHAKAALLPWLRRCSSGGLVSNPSEMAFWLRSGGRWGFCTPAWGQCRVFPVLGASWRSPCREVPGRDPTAGSAGASHHPCPPSSYE